MATRNPPRSLNYDPFDVLLRELGGGIWFWVSGALALAFAAFILREVNEKRRTGQPWTRKDYVAVGSAIGLGIFALGSCLRGYLNWMQFHYLRKGQDATLWIDLWPWFGSSIACSIIGGLIAIWFLTTWRYRTLFVVMTFLLAIGVPVAFYFDPG